jgi:3-hydroxybutyryl-CoA dehydrogenase
MDFFIKTICVCGAGTMGNGIAQVCAASGYFTILFDPDAKAIQKAINNIEQDLQKLVSKQKISEGEKHQTLAKLRFSSDINDCIGDLVIEAIIENAGAKISLFQQLSVINNKQTIFVTNTSSLSVTEIALQLENSNKFAGLHFFNPAPLMKLVEVIKAIHTNEDTIQILLSFINSLNKTPVVCKDFPGFIVNRVARPYYIESLRLMEEGKVSLGTIDKVLESHGFKMGPFKLMDLIGNDINYAVSCSVYDQLNKPNRLKPSAIQKEKVDKGELGKKTGRGYYQY